MVTVTQKNLNDGSAKVGRLYLVDLAGSEKVGGRPSRAGGRCGDGPVADAVSSGRQVGKTGASGQTLEEAKKINKSLTSLGMVINALTDGKVSQAR